MTFSVFSLIGLAALAAAGWLGFKILQGTVWCFGKLCLGLKIVLLHVFGFVRNELLDTVHFVGALVTGLAILPLSLINLLIGRFRSAGYYGRAAEDELVSSLLSLYRVVLGNPLRLLGLGLITDGFERRIPDLMERSPTARTKDEGTRRLEFPGYELLGTLPAGGSGAQLFVARPKSEKLSKFREAGHAPVEDVVIKSFALEQGSTLPQIVRESRALAAGYKLGLVLEHHLTDERFFYVTRYVRGEELDVIVDRLHAGGSPEGLEDEPLREVMGYAQDLLSTLERFHSVGLWHKDVKPANLIVAANRAHLVDIGLVTPLHSALTLTTHGTEYFRDPEMVRLAMRGVKVHEVDGVKFDIYSSGALLYSMIENSFPAHGSLSRLSKRCPEALQWIVRRSMADMNARYTSASQMRGDLAALSASSDPFAMRPADLPSFRGTDVEPEPHDEEPFVMPLATPEPEPELVGAAASGGKSRSQRRRLSPEERRRRRRRGLAFLGGMVLFSVAVENIQESRRGVTSSMSQGISMARQSANSPEVAEVIRILEEVGRSAQDNSIDTAPPMSLEPAHELVSESPEEQPENELVGVWDRELESALPVYEPDLERSSGTVLVLEDLSPTKNNDELLAALELHLLQRGYAVYGGPEGSLDDPDAVRFLAGAKNAVGLSDPTDTEALLMLQEYLDVTIELDAIVWLAPGDDKDSQIYRLLLRRGVTNEPPRRLAVGASSK